MKSNIGFGGSLALQHIKPRGPGILWKLSNLGNVLPGLAKHALAKTLNMNHMLGSLRIRHFKANGECVDYGLVSTNLVTTAFCELMVDQLIAESSVWGDFKYHDSGIGVTGANIADTDIETTDNESRATGTQVESTSVIYESVGTISYTGTLAITEHGIFNASTSVTLLDRHTFSAVNVVNGDSIQFTYDLTCTAGG